MDKYIKEYANSYSRRNKGEDSRSVFIRFRITEKDWEAVQESLNTLEVTESQFFRGMLSFYFNSKTNL